MVFSTSKTYILASIAALVVCMATVSAAPIPAPEPYSCYDQNYACNSNIGKAQA
ncbi:hypothetical protein BG000_007614, partial [Podila horticola]